MENVKDKSEVSETKHEAPRNKEMKVLVLGLGRTGTTALASGLRQLGYTPYDYLDRFPQVHSQLWYSQAPSQLWDSAMRAKFYGIGKPWTSKDFRDLTRGFDCILDVPCCFFAEELCKAYPNARVILNTRDPDEWLESMRRTLFTVFQWRSWQLLRYLDPTFTGVWCRHNELIWGYFCDNEYDNGEKCKRRFLAHYEYVRRVVPAERLLEYDIKDGWKPLTDFLGLPEFSGEVKRNSTEDCLAAHVKLWWIRLRMSLLNLAMVTAGVGVILVSLALAQGRWMSFAYLWHS